jgi:hypothetical protein
MRGERHRATTGAEARTSACTKATCDASGTASGAGHRSCCGLPLTGEGKETIYCRDYRRKGFSYSAIRPENLRDLWSGGRHKKRPASFGAGHILFGDDGVLNPFPLFN